MRVRPRRYRAERPNRGDGMARTTGGDLVIKLWTEVAALKAEFAESRLTMAEMQVTISEMQGAISEMQGAIGVLQTATVGLADGFSRLQANAASTERHLTRFGKLIGELAERTGERLDDHEARLRALELKN